MENAFCNGAARIEESEGGDGARAVRRQSTSTCRPSRGNRDDISRSAPAPPSGDGQLLDVCALVVLSAERARRRRDE